MATSTLGSGTLVLAGTTSGTTTVTATAVAGTTTLTLPAATDTLVGKATTDTLTNKTLTGAVITSSTGAFTTLTSTGASSFATSSGDVGVGTASPAAKLHISVASAAVDGTKGVRITNPAGTIAVFECGSGGDSFIGTTSGSDFNIRTGNSLVTTFFNNGNVQLQKNISVGAATPSTSGVGITFPATQSASSDANTLDDYEEGSWTPSLGGTTTYTVQEGQYTKIGRLVNIRCNIVVNLIGTGSTVVISGLPFSSFSTASLNPTASASVGYFASLAVSPVYVSAYVNQNNTTMNISGLTAANSTATASLTIFGNSARIDLTMTYFTN